jgi:hypothetical protein
MNCPEKCKENMCFTAGHEDQMKLKPLMACWQHGKCMRDVQMKPVWSHGGVLGIPAVAHELYNRTGGWKQMRRVSAESVQTGPMSSHSVPSANWFHLKNPHTLGSFLMYRIIFNSYWLDTCVPNWMVIHYRYKTNVAKLSHWRSDTVQVSLSVGSQHQIYSEFVEWLQRLNIEA